MFQKLFWTLYKDRLIQQSQLCELGTDSILALKDVETEA